VTLFVVNNAQVAQVGADLAHIVGTDNGNLGLSPPAGGQEQVTYAQTQNDIVKNRMNFLINTTAFPIVITGVTNTFVLPDGTPITQAAGATSVPKAAVNTAGTGVNPGTTITVVYDVTGCGGVGYCVFDTGGHSVADPTEGILFHELAHAFHWANNDFDQANPEPQAENDENQLRTQEGLTPRDPNNHSGGCTGQCTQPSKGCLVATAAFGSPAAPEVASLRLLRDDVLRGTDVGLAWFDELFADYHRFSAAVAHDMRASPWLREIVRVLAVEPLLRFWRLAWRCLHELEPHHVLVEPAGAGLRSSFRDVAAIVPEPAAVAEVAERVAALEAVRHVPVAPCHEVTFERSVPGVVDYLATQVSRAPTAGPVRWAMARPLALHWAALQRLAAGEEAAAVARDHVSGAIDWTRSLPAPLGPVPWSSEEAARDDLSSLRAFLLVDRVLRQRFGSRLLWTQERRTSFPLRPLLLDLDYLRADVEADEHDG
jgi:hypothetical protein